MKKQLLLTILIAGVLIVSSVGLAGVSNPSDTSTLQASDADLDTLSSPTVNRYVYATTTGAYVFVASGTVGSDIGAQSLDTILTNLSALVTAADQLPYFIGADAWGTTTITASARGLLDDDSTTTMKATLAADNITTAGRSLTRTTDDFAADAELFTRTATFNLINPSSTNNFTDGAVAFFPRLAITITEVGCHSLQAGTTTIQLDERAENTPGTAGTDILSATIACGTASASTTSFANATIAAANFVNLDVDVQAGAPSSTVLYVEFVVDD